MDERIKRAIDNNETSIFYSSDFVMSSSIREYILNSKKRIINDILSLKLWLDDLLLQKVYLDMDFVKASILAGNIDVASNFDNEEIHWFLTININKIIDFMLKKVYVLSNNTPSILIKNDNFVKICLDNGFIQVLEHAPRFKKYYYENKYNIDSKCVELISNNIIHIDKFSSKLLKNNPDFVLLSVKRGNFDLLFFNQDIEVNKYIVDNYRFFKKDFYDYVRKNNYFITTKLDIKLPSVKMLYCSCLKREVFSDKIDSSLLLMASDNLENFMSYLDVESINYLFGKKIGKIYSIYGNKIFGIGYENLIKISNSSSTAFDRFIKIFDPNVTIKMESVKDFYFLMNREYFAQQSIFNKNSGNFVCESIKKEGIFNEDVNKIINSIKNIIDLSYFDYLCNLIDDNNLNINTGGKNSAELINEIFEYYRRLSINFDGEKLQGLEKVINELCEVAKRNEFDVYMSTKLNFSNGYPFLVEPSDIYLKRVGKEQRINNIKSYISSNKDYFNYFCEKNYVNFKQIEYKDFKKDVKKYLENKRCVYGLEDYLEGVLSRLSKNDIVDVSQVDYYNLPLTDEYLRSFISIDTLFNVLKKINFGRVLYYLNDDTIYNKFKEILFDKQLLYLLDCFKENKCFYSVDSLVSLINNFDLLVENEDVLSMFELSKENDKLPSVFSYLFDNYYLLNNSKNIISLSKRMFNTLEKEYTPVPYISSNVGDFKVEIGGFDIGDAYIGLSISSDVMVSRKYDSLHGFIMKDSRGFMIKFYKEELRAIVYGIRYGNAIFLCNLESCEDDNIIIECLNNFINKVVDKMKTVQDEIASIYLSRKDGKLNKTFANCLKNIGVKIDFLDTAICLYDSGKKIVNSTVKYKIMDTEYSDINVRSNKINILRLVNSGDMESLIDYKYITATKVGRNWYKDSEDIVLE